MGFTKLDSGILQSSIMFEDSDTFKIWIALLASCDKDGLARVSAVFLQSICHIEMDVVLGSLERLSSPDPLSRSQNNNGRRIERVDGGYRIINHGKYRDFSYSQKPAAKRKRKERERRRDIMSHMSHPHPPLTTLPSGNKKEAEADMSQNMSQNKETPYGRDSSYSEYVGRKDESFVYVDRTSVISYNGGDGSSVEEIFRNRSTVEEAWMRDRTDVANLVLGTPPWTKDRRYQKLIDVLPVNERYPLDHHRAYQEYQLVIQG